MLCFSINKLVESRWLKYKYRKRHVDYRWPWAQSSFFLYIRNDHQWREQLMMTSAMCCSMLTYGYVWPRADVEHRRSEYKQRERKYVPFSPSLSIFFLFFSKHIVDSSLFSIHTSTNTLYFFLYSEMILK